MDRKTLAIVTLGLLAVLSATGCQSPSRAGQGAAVGSLLGAGAGAITGDTVGKAGPGAAIGAGLGAIAGAAVGSELDQIEAQNRAMIARQLGRQVSASAVTLDDVVAMSQAGVDEELIVNHVRAHGVAAPLQTSDLIFLQQQGVGTRVIKAMQEPPPQPARPVVVRESVPPPVIVEEHHYGSPFWGPPFHARYYHRRPRRSGVSWGLSFSN